MVEFYTCIILILSICIYKLTCFTLDIERSTKNPLATTQHRGLFSVDAGINTAFQITTSFYLGNPPQKFNVIVDTGSSLIWLSSFDCLGCHYNSSFNYMNSTSYIKQSEHTITQTYGDGSTIIGYLSKDSGGLLLNYTLDLSFLTVIQSTLPQTTDGLIGFGYGSLSNIGLDQSLIDQYHNYDKTFKREFSISYINNTNGIITVGEDITVTKNLIGKCGLNSTIYWACDLKGVILKNVTNNTLYNTPGQLINFDSGSTINVLTYNLFVRIYNDFFAADPINCKILLSNGMNNIICPSTNPILIYPNITFSLNNIEVLLTPEKYLYNAGNNTFASFISLVNNGTVLDNINTFGFITLRYFTTLYDKDNSTIELYDNTGYDSGARNDSIVRLNTYPVPDTYKSWIIIVVILVVVIGGLSIITIVVYCYCTRCKNKNEKQPIGNIKELNRVQI